MNVDVKKTKVFDRDKPSTMSNKQSESKTGIGPSGYSEYHDGKNLRYHVSVTLRERLAEGGKSLEHLNILSLIMREHISGL